MSGKTDAECGEYDVEAEAHCHLVARRQKVEICRGLRQVQQHRVTVWLGYDGCDAAKNRAFGICRTRRTQDSA